MSKFKDLSQLAKTYKAYMSRTEICRYPPTRIWVETTSHCNLRCSFCGNRDLAKEERGYMDFGLFAKIADEAAGRVHQFNMFHRGESLLHPKIADMVLYAKDRGIHTRINTNGTRLTKEIGKKLIGAGLDILSFSFDGYNQEMYEKNRPGAKFDLVLENIINFLELKKSMATKKPFVAMEVMELSDWSASEMAKMREKFQSQFNGLPLDKFIIRHQHNWAGLVNTNTGNKNEKHMIPCPLLWHALIIFWDGRVLPCPQDFFGTLKLGDVNDKRLMEIWNGEALRTLRKEMADTKALSRHPCVECDRILRSTIAGVPTDYLGRFLSENVFGNTWLSRILPH